jgi:predicted nucleic-acid-binding Zn-ribbon protein
MIRKCGNCKREEDYENQFDCEDWSEDQIVILCDDCFFNDLYKKDDSSRKFLR